MERLNEIYSMCMELANLWSKIPNWRLGQLLVNVSSNREKDLFYLKDDELVEAAKKYLQLIKK